MIEKNGNLELLRRIYAAVEGQDKEDVKIKKQKDYAHKKLAEKW